MTGEQATVAVIDALEASDIEYMLVGSLSTSAYGIARSTNEFTVELFQLSADPHDQERFQRRHQWNVLGRQVQLPTAEDVIVTKLRWAAQGRRSKDRDDARDVMAVQGDRLDWNYIRAWCDRHGTRELMEEIRASIPPL